MEIFCDYCGSRFETEGCDCCPSCGAPFSQDSEMKNAAAQERKLHELRMKEQELRLMEAELNSVSEKRRKSKKNPVMTVTFVVFFITFFIITFSVIGGIRSNINVNISGIKDASSSIKERIPKVTFTEEADVPVTVSFNETAETVHYSVICDSFEKIDRYPFTPDDGYMYVTFHFRIKNTGIGKLNPPSSFYCSVNGEICSKTWDSERREPPMGTLPAGVSTSGNICFEVPVDAESFDIRYGDYVTIHIDNTLE